MADLDVMAQAVSLPNADPPALAAVSSAAAAEATVPLLDTLPAEWEQLHDVRVGHQVVDHVVIGPNGLFTIDIDADPEVAVAKDDGIYRMGSRVTTPVKAALLGAFRLRARLGEDVFPYPILVTPLEASHHMLGRLGVVPGERIAELIWAHPGRPLRRSERVKILSTLRALR